MRDHPTIPAMELPTAPSRHRGDAPLRVLVILGHARRDSFCAALADAYVSGAREAGVEVRFLRVADMDFELNVLEPSPEDQYIEASVGAAMDLVVWAEHLVFVFPTWWGTMPALLKGFLDRVLVPGFAFEFREDGEGWHRFLKDRTAHLLTTMDTPPFVYRWIYGAPGLNGLARATLGFCGIAPVRRTIFGPVKDSDAGQRQGWLAKAYREGRRLKHGVLTRPERIYRRLAAWFAALRLQFYPMVWGAFGVGTLTGLQPSGHFAMAPFWLGLASLVALEVATVFINELNDWESDRLNTHAGPFTGGSRVLVDGRLTRTQLMHGTAAALVATAGLVWALPVASAVAYGTFAMLAVLAIGYTAPPLKLCWRGLGEVTVAATHSVFVLLFAHTLQGGRLNDPLPWALSLPLFFSILPSITLSGIPDYDADRAAGKRTLAVILGPRGAVRFAQTVSIVPALTVIALQFAGPAAELFRWLTPFVLSHAAWLVVRLERYLGQRRPPGRIDGLMTLSLLYILWFVGIPLWRL